MHEKKHTGIYVQVMFMFTQPHMYMYILLHT